MNLKFPYTIHNSTGESLTFLGITNRDGIEYLEAENRAQPKAGPPMHVHYKQDESFTVVSGKLAYQVPGEEVRYGGPGDTILFPAGKPHKFWNAGEDELVCSGFISPPGNAVYFLSQIFKSTAENGGRPGLFDIAFLVRTYRSEFAMLEIPTFVQRLIIPLIFAVGKVTGKYRKFRDAPKPM